MKKVNGNYVNWNSQEKKRFCKRNFLEMVNNLWLESNQHQIFYIISRNSIKINVLGNEIIDLGNKQNYFKSENYFIDLI